MDWETSLEKQEIVLVEWIDSSTDNGWEFVKNIKVDDDKTCFSVGYLLGTTKDFIIIAGDVDLHEKTQNRLLQIPRVALKSLWSLSRGKKNGKLGQKKSR